MTDEEDRTAGAGPVDGDSVAGPAGDDSEAESAEGDSGPGPADGDSGPEPLDVESADPDALREDLDAIKSAMGLEDRYPGQARMWLVYGAVIGLTAVVTNVAFVFDLSNAAYVAGWFAMVIVVVLAQLRLVARTSGTAAPGVDWRQLFVAMAVALLALWTALGDVIAAQTDGATRGAHYFSHVLIFLALAFVVVGVVLGAERISLRDRLPFYVGGAWMLALAAFLPHVEVLRLSGWAVFGVLFAIHSAAAYLVTREG